MATQFTTEYSKDLDPRTAGALSVYQGMAPLFAYRFSLTAAAGIDGEVINLRFLPPGRFTVYPRLSYLQIDALGASRVMAVGTAAYTDEAGNAVGAAASAWDSAISVASAVNLQLGASVAAGTGGVFEYNSRSGITIQATITGGTVPVSSKINGFIMLGAPGGC
jgi:hypothetical protein